jgi:hypothetical protein
MNYLVMIYFINTNHIHAANIRDSTSDAMTTQRAIMASSSLDLNSPFSHQ